MVGPQRCRHRRRAADRRLPDLGRVLALDLLHQRPHRGSSCRTRRTAPPRIARPDRHRQDRLRGRTGSSGVPHRHYIRVHPGTHTRLVFADSAHDDAGRRGGTGRVPDPGAPGDLAMLPLSIFRERQFAATNAVTFIVYAALVGATFLLPVVLQVVSGYSPLASGLALLPLTVIMLALSARSGKLAARIGPRLQMSAGPVVVGVGLGLFVLSTYGSSYVVYVLPAVVVFGLGLAITVAPLTSTAMSSAPAEHSGIASAVNNDVARFGGLLAVAVLPALAGITGSAYLHPGALTAGFRTAVLISAALCAGGGLLAAFTITNPPRLPRLAGAPEPADCLHCGLEAPPLTTRVNPDSQPAAAQYPRTRRQRPGPSGPWQPFREKKIAAKRLRVSRSPCRAQCPHGRGSASRVFHAMGGGVPSALAASAGSHAQTAQAWPNTERANSSAVPCGSGLERTSSQSSMYRPMPESQRAARWVRGMRAKSSGAGCAEA